MTARRHVVWLGHLWLGYGLALTYLAKALDAQSDFDSQVTAILGRAAGALQINASDSEDDR